MDITVNELKERIDACEAPIMVDVREPHEWEMQALPEVIQISLGDIPAALEKLAPFKEQEIVMICRSGGRSGRATAFLQSAGFSNVRNLNGGMLAWKAYIDPSFAVM